MFRVMSVISGTNFFFLPRFGHLPIVFRYFYPGVSAILPYSFALFLRHTLGLLCTFWRCRFCVAVYLFLSYIILSLSARLENVPVVFGL